MLELCHGEKMCHKIAKLYADNKVDVIIYAVEKSLDSYKFNLLHCKATFTTNTSTTTVSWQWLTPMPPA